MMVKPNSHFRLKKHTKSIYKVDKVLKYDVNLNGISESELSSLMFKLCLINKNQAFTLAKSNLPKANPKNLKKRAKRKAIDENISAWFPPVYKLLSRIKDKTRKLGILTFSQENNTYFGELKDCRLKVLIVRGINYLDVYLFDHPVSHSHLITLFELNQITNLKYKTK